MGGMVGDAVREGDAVWRAPLCTPFCDPSCTCVPTPRQPPRFFLLFVPSSYIQYSRRSCCKDAGFFQTHTTIVKQSSFTTTYRQQIADAATTETDRKLRCGKHQLCILCL